MSEETKKRSKVSIWFDAKYPDQEDAKKILENEKQKSGKTYSNIICEALQVYANYKSVLNENMFRNPYAEIIKEPEKEKKKELSEGTGKEKKEKKEIAKKESSIIEETFPEELDLNDGFLAGMIEE